MAKTIRNPYPLQISIGLLLLIFIIAFALSSQIFRVSWREMLEGTNVYFGMLLVSTSVLIMVLILWEELLFPLKVKPSDGGLIFRNHRNKLKTQVLIYLLIPVIYLVVFSQFPINQPRFYIWASLCTVIPVVVRLKSGINNYNDFLKLTDKFIEFKNNRQAGIFQIDNIQQIVCTKDKGRILHKIKLITDNQAVMIDLDEMELEGFYEAIDEYLSAHYQPLIRESQISIQNNS